MFKINEQVQCGIYVEGKEIALDTGGFMQSLHISVNATTRLPTVVIKLVDMFGLLVNAGLQDNSPIVVSLRGAINYDRNFRVYTWSRLPAGDGFVYTINGYWDAPKYWSGTTNQGIEGSSSAALAKIASACGLKSWTKNANTSDSMVWMPGNKTYSGFARDIARAGYINDTSHMGLCVDSEGFMRYVDINAIPKPAITVGYVPTDKSTPFLVITDFAPTTTAGNNNRIAGYAHDRVVQGVETNSSEKSVYTEKKIQLVSDSQIPLVNTKVRERVERGGVSYSPINFGNVHPKYERARYQNTRFNLLNNMMGEFLFPYQTPLEPFDNFTYTAPPQQGNTTYNGEYTITDKIIYVAGSSYYEKIIGVKNGLER